MNTAQRLAHNEAIFRDINERIEAGVWPGSAAGGVTFTCECAALRCNVTLEMSVPEYEAVRAHSRRFLLAPGHEIPAIETVVHRGDGYIVVEKQGEAAVAAEATDPR